MLEMESTSEKLLINIVIHKENLIVPSEITIGDWIDLRAAEEVHIEKFGYAEISLGLSMQLPLGYEAHLAPRSGTFRNYGIIQTNSVGVIDQKYEGTNDIWKMPVYATRDTDIHFNDRICQFRIIEKMPKVRFNVVTELSSVNRGGFNSTGVK